MSKVSFLTRYQGKHFFIIAVMGTVLVVLLLAFQFTNVELQSEKRVVPKEEHSTTINWKEVNLKKLSIPNSIRQELNTVEIKDSNVVLEGQKVGGVDVFHISHVDVFHKECNPTEPEILLLLHGAAFTSNTWTDSVPTMQTMCSLGYRVVAIDLPGYGKTPSCNGCDKAELLRLVLANILGHSARPVIVSPSMSGSWSLPFIKEHQDLVRGFVPVAPVQTSTYKDFFKASMKVPTMIVYGEKDTGLGVQSYNDLKEISTSTKPQILKDAKHPAYLDQPDEWHSLLHNFLQLLK